MDIVTTYERPQSPMIPWNRMKTILVLALPIIGGMCSEQIIRVFDTMMIGFLGNQAIAALGLGSMVFSLMNSPLSGIPEAVQALVGRHFGSGRHELLKRPLMIGILMSLGLGGLMTGLSWVLVPIALKILIPDPAVQELGTRYCLVLSLGLTPLMVNFCFRSYWNGINQPLRYTIILIGTHLCTILLNGVLIFGFFGFPNLGVLGAAIGASIIHLISMIVYSFSLGLSLTDWRSLRPLVVTEVIDECRAMLKIAVPASLRNIFFILGILSFYWLVGFLGTDQVAIMHVHIQLILFVILPGVGFGMTALSLVSQSLGRQNMDEAQQWGWDVTKLAVFVTIVVSVIGFLFPQWVLGAFIHDPTTLAQAIVPFRFECVFIWIEVAGLVLIQALVGVGQADRVFRISLFAQWLLFFPLGCLLGPILKTKLLFIIMAWVFYQLVATGIFVMMWSKREQW